jgi:Tetratricopeptide repeat
VIEQLLEAERMLSVGLIDQAERLYRGVADHDPGSSIAVMGLARVALERGDDRTAYIEARRALAIDPENPSAQHMVMRLAEVMAGRGETPPPVDPAPATPPPTSQVAAPGSEAATPSVKKPPASPRKRRGLVDRLLGRRP